MNLSVLGCFLGAAVFVIAAVLGERHALYIPAVVLVFATLLQLLA